MLELFGILKMGRVLRLNKIIQFLNVSEDVKASMKLTKMIFFLTIYIHCFACLWWIVVKHDRNWVSYKEQRPDGRDFYAIYNKLIGS